MLAALTLAVAFAVQDDIPTLLVTKSKLTCLDWAMAANHYIREGEVQASADLILASGTKPGSRANRRTALLCRVLFQGKGLRPPKLGDLGLPSMSLSSWP